YHSDRFCYYFLLVLHDKKIVAIFPAKIRDKVVCTHQGLTYGGLIVQNGERTTNQLDYCQVIFDFLISQNIQELIIKETPVFYHKHFNDILPYVSYVSEARTIKSEICSVIDLTVRSDSQSQFAEMQITQRKKAFLYTKQMIYLFSGNIF